MPFSTANNQLPREPLEETKESFETAAPAKVKVEEKVEAKLELPLKVVANPEVS